MTGEFFRAHDGKRIHFVTEGAGCPLVLIHGVGADLESWTEATRAVVGRFSVIRADLRGHGQSDRITDCSIDDFVEDVADLLRTTNHTKVNLVGFSLGGLIAQHFALKYPERINRLILVSTVAQRTAEERTRVLQRAAILKDDGIESIVAAAENRWFTDEYKAAHPDRVERRLAELKANDHKSYTAAYTVFATADENIAFEKIKAPTLIVTGENDVGSNPRMARLLHESIAGSKLEILPKLRHSVLIESPDQIGSLILDFLRP